MLDTNPKPVYVRCSDEDLDDVPDTVTCIFPFIGHAENVHRDYVYDKVYQEALCVSILKNTN